MIPKTRGGVTVQDAPYPRGPVEHNPDNDRVISAAPDEPSTYEKEAARIAEVKRVARSA
jgi:hypothetical protein